MRRLIIDTDTASDDAVAIMMALADELTRGMTVVDRLGTSGRESNAEVVFRIDAARWKALLRESLA